MTACNNKLYSLIREIKPSKNQCLHLKYLTSYNNFYSVCSNEIHLRQYRSIIK